jgi:hypothetical protein
VNALLRGIGQTVERKVARSHLIPRAGNTDLWLYPVFIAHTNGAKHSSGSGFFDAIGYVAASWFDIRRHNNKFSI